MHITKALSALALPLVAAGVLCAQQPQQPQPVTRVSLYKVALDKTGAFIAKGKLFVPTLDALLAEGAIVSYAIEQDYIHVPDATNVAFWYTAADFAGLAKADAAVDAFAAKNPQLLADLTALTDMSAHRDLIVRSPVMNTKPSSACMPKFSYMNIEKIKPGKVQDDVQLFRKYSKDVMDSLLASGAICAYGYDVESIHTSAPGMTFKWIMLPELGSIDKVRAASRAAFQKLSESERNLLEAFNEANSDAAAHRDGLAVIEAYKSK
jgi:hypothetical protein